MDRRAFLIVLIVACGCGPNEAPKNAADANHAAPTGANTPGGTQQSAIGLARLEVAGNPTNAGVPPLLANVNDAARPFKMSYVHEGRRCYVTIHYKKKGSRCI